LLDRLDVEKQLKYPKPNTFFTSQALVISAILLEISCPPDRHGRLAMSWHERRTVNDLKDVKYWKKAIVVFPNLSEVRRFNGEKLRHWPIASTAHAMTGEARPLVLSGTDHVWFSGY
jgi:hypothetical protein